MWKCLVLCYINFIKFEIIENRFRNGGFVVFKLIWIFFLGLFRLFFFEVFEWNEEELWFWVGGVNSGGIFSNGGKKVVFVRVWIFVVRYYFVF